MVDRPIEHVADTAFWVATYRANESARIDALFQDPLAARLVEGRGRAIAERMADTATVGWAVVIRTCIIDDYIRAAILHGCDTVLNLGAGLDTRPYRMALPPSLSWIEVDFPATIEFKEERLAGEQPRCQLERVKLDLGDASARRTLFDEINSRAGRVFVLTEGVVPYLRSCGPRRHCDEGDEHPNAAGEASDAKKERPIRAVLLRSCENWQGRMESIKLYVGIAKCEQKVG